MIVSRAQRGVRPGFTLLEVLTVVAIIVIVAGAGAMVVFRYVDESRDNRAIMDIKTLETAVDSYKLSTGEYPASLEILTQPFEGKPAYLDSRALVDPWNRPYMFEPGNTHPNTGRPRIYSQGARPGDPNAIKSNW